MRQLFPVGGGRPLDHGATGDGTLDDDALARLYRYPVSPATDDGGWLRANMVASLDGRAAVDGSSRGLSSDADRHLLGLLRALADVVVVGAGTVRAEGYRPPRVRPERAVWRAAAGQPPDPVLAVVSGRLDLPPDLPLFADPRRRPLVLTAAETAEAAGVPGHLADAADVVRLPDLHGRTLRAALVHRGRRRILCEGGPSLLGSLVAAGVLDELCLTVSPVIAGGGGPRLLGDGGPAAAIPLELCHLLEADGLLLGRWAVRRG